MESPLLADLACYLDGTKWSLHLHFKKIEVLGDPPDTNNIIIQLTKEETEVKREGRLVLPLRVTG